MRNSYFFSPASLVLLGALLALGIQIRIHSPEISAFVVQLVVDQSVRQSNLAEAKLAAFKVVIGADNSGSGASGAFAQRVPHPGQ